ncbi:hypothetical protein ACLM5H_16555 [Fredinandcohnia humi]
MYKHDIHKAFTNLFFYVITIFILVLTVSVSLPVGEYTYMIALLFSIVGSFCISEIYLGLGKSIQDKGLLALFVRYLFTVPVFASNCLIILFCNWLVMQYGLVETLDYTWYTVVGGIVWLLSFHLAKVMPNLPAMVLKKEQ